MSVIGRIIGGAPTIAYAGSELTADADSADTVIAVADVGDFDDDALINGGVLILGATVDTDGDLDLTGAALVPYTTCDDDASTITLQGALGADWSEGDSIYVLDPVTGEPVVQAEVYVEVEGADHTGDGLPAIVTYGLLGKIGDTDDEANGQVVTLEEDEDEQLTVVDVHGAAHATGDLLGHQDGHVAASPTDLSFDLTYRPIPHRGAHLWWNGIPQEDDAWSREGWTVTVDDPDGLVEAGDRFYMKYLYRDKGLKPIVPASLFLVGSTFVGYGATSIPLPDETQAGDLLVLAICGDTDVAGGDDRIVDFDAQGPFYGLWLGHGYEDGSGTDLPVTLGTGGPAHSVRADLVVFRTTGDVHKRGFTPLTSVSPATPSMPSDDMGIVALAGRSGTVAGPFNNDSLGHWTSVVSGVYAGFGANMIAYSLSGTPAGSWGGAASSHWIGLVLGITEEGAP